MEMDEHKRRRNMILYVLIALVVYLVLNTLLFPNMARQVKVEDVNYSQFLDDLEEKKVDAVQYTEGEYTALYTLKGGDGSVAYQCTVMPNDSDLTNRITDAGATLDVIIPNTDSSIWTYYLLTLGVPFLIFFGIGWWLNRRMKKAMGDDGPSMNFGGGGFGGAGGLGKSGARKVKSEDVGVTFKDVAGQEEAKESLKEVVDFLENPKRYEDIGARLPRGALLVGHPRHGQDATREGRRRRGGRVVLQHLGFRIRRDVRRSRRCQGARPLQAGE